MHVIATLPLGLNLDLSAFGILNHVELDASSRWLQLRLLA
jgi:hypothetical protein